MNQVRMRHTDVEGEVMVAESAVPFHASAGWEVVEDDTRPAGNEQADGGESGGEQRSSGRPRASAAKKKEQD